MRVLILIGCLLTTMTTGRSSPVTGSYGRLPGGGNGLAGGGRAVGAHPRRLWPLWFPLQTPMEIDYNGYDDTSLNPANMVVADLMSTLPDIEQEKSRYYPEPNKLDNQVDLDDPSKLAKREGYLSSISSMCHFKICNLGKRRSGRQTGANRWPFWS